MKMPETPIKWGIYEQAIAMGWQPETYSSNQGWKYPLYNLNGTIQSREDGTPIYRWKNADSISNFKYAWLPDKPDHTLSLYFHPEIEKAVADAQGNIFFAEGEKDLLTFHAAGIYNVISWFGANSVPSELVESLKLLGVTHVTYLPDRDDAGYKSAHKVAEALAGSGIAYQAIELPDLGVEKADVNDWWIACDFDRELFRAQLQDRIQNHVLNVHIDHSADTNAPEPRYNHNSSYNGDLPSNFVVALEDALNIKKVNARGYARICCPFHDDNHPSADWDTNRHILHCFPCGETFLAKEVGAHLGIHLRDYYDNPPQSKVNKSTMTTPPDAPQNKKPPTPTDDEVGDNIIKRWAGQRINIYNEWYQYGNGVWKPVPSVNKDVWNAMIRFKDRKYKPSQGKKASVKNYLEAMLTVPNDQADNGDGVLNLQNGLLDLDKRVLRAHDKERYLTSQLPFAYDPDATCPQWLAFLNDVLVDINGIPDPDLIDLVQEAIGYSLTSDTHHEKMFWLYGDAATGKSTMLKVIKALLGTASKELSLSTLQRNQYQLAEIGGKRVITCSEAMSGTVLADDYVKKLVSGEEIVTRQIYRKPQSIKPQSKLWWAMNEVPQNLDRSNAIYRRLSLIPFLNPVPADQRDLYLIDKLLEELPGILNWALEGLERLEMNGQFTQVEQINEAVFDYQHENDTEAQFLAEEEWVESIGEFDTKASDLYMAYKAYCTRFGFEIKTKTRVARDWKRLGINKKRTSDGNMYSITLSSAAQRIVKTQRQKDGEDRA